MHHQSRRSRTLRASARAVARQEDSCLPGVSLRDNDRQVAKKVGQEIGADTHLKHALIG